MTGKPGQHLGRLRTQVFFESSVTPIATIKRDLDFIVGIYRISAELVYGPGDLPVCFTCLTGKPGQHLGRLRTQVFFESSVTPIATIKRDLDFIVGIYRISAELVYGPGDLPVCFTCLTGKPGQHLGRLRTQVLLQRGITPIATIKSDGEFV